MDLINPFFLYAAFGGVVYPSQRNETRPVGIYKGASDPLGLSSLLVRGYQIQGLSLHSAESSMVHGVVSRGGRLQLSHLQPAQAATYTCVAENAQAEARKDFVVSVLGISCTLHPLLFAISQQPLLLPGPHHSPCYSASPDPELRHGTRTQCVGETGDTTGLRG